ncbi:MAG: GIY-YIG nuclease family protein [Chlamydiia bacterium]|nr:GIY-YIG nuclease family protein [Chlamydiia bacterium]
MMKKVSTYILHDKVRDIYKIGKSSDPKVRIKTLCIPGEVEPIKLFNEDLEKKLHEEFKEYRIDHPLYKDGGTEWFKYGGKFKEYIDALEKEQIPFYTPHSLYQILDENGQFSIDTRHTYNVLKENEYYRYSLGRKMLTLLGYLYYRDSSYQSIHPGILIQDNKIFISAEVVHEIISKYTINIVSTHIDNYINKTTPGVMFLRKIGKLINGEDIYLLITLLKKR